MKHARPAYTVIEHPAGFNPWDNNPVLIRLFAEAVRASVNRRALRRSEDAANHHSAAQDLTTVYTQLAGK